jgi:nitrilase
MSNPALTYRLAIIEMNSQANILANLAVIDAGVRAASERQAQLVVLPENAFCFGNQAHASQYFEPLSDWASQLARECGVYLLAGTLPCPFRPDRTPVSDGKFRQTSLLFDPTGETVARYDKIHLFKATVNDKTGNYDEGRTFEAGNQLVVADTELGKIGLMICFDIRFSPLALRLRQLGAQMLTAPSAFTYQTGKAHWQTLLTARALDSQCLVIGAGQAGTHYFTNRQGLQQRETWGHSLFVNAHGDVMNEGITLPPVNAAHLAPSKLLQAATSWLAAPTSESDAQYQPDAARLLITDFNPQHQQQWRANIDLQASYRFADAELMPASATGTP